MGLSILIPSPHVAIPPSMIKQPDEQVIDVHGHLTEKTLAAIGQMVHKALLKADKEYTGREEDRYAHLKAFLSDWSNIKDDKGNPAPEITDALIIQSIGPVQLMRMVSRGITTTIFSPRASAMRPDLGSPAVSRVWSEWSNDLVERVCNLLPAFFVGAAQLPQSPGTSMEASAAELTRCVTEKRFVGANMNPDSSGGGNTEPVLTNPYWHPFYNTAAALGATLMPHPSGVREEDAGSFHSTFQRYLTTDMDVWANFLHMEKIKLGQTNSPPPENLFQGPRENLHVVVPHMCGGAIQHKGRYDGGLQDQHWPSVDQQFGRNVRSDLTCYDLRGLAMGLQNMPRHFFLFGSETQGCLREEAFYSQAEFPTADGKRVHRDHTKAALDYIVIQDPNDRMKNVHLSEDFKRQLWNTNPRETYPLLEEHVYNHRERLQITADNIAKHAPQVWAQMQLVM